MWNSFISFTVERLATLPHPKSQFVPSPEQQLEYEQKIEEIQGVATVENSFWLFRIRRQPLHLACVRRWNNFEEVEKLHLIFIASNEECHTHTQVHGMNTYGSHIAVSQEQAHHESAFVYAESIATAQQSSYRIALCTQNEIVLFALCSWCLQYFVTVSSAHRVAIENI